MPFVAIAGLYAAAMFLCRRNWKQVIVMTLILLGIATLCFHSGFQSGINHTLDQATFFAEFPFTGYTDPLGNDYDCKLTIELGGDIYEQGMWIG